MIRVVLADDHPFVRTGIRDILLKSPDIAVIGEAEDGFQALQLAEELSLMYWWLTLRCQD